MVQTKRGAKPEVGSIENIEATRGPDAPRGRWARSSRALAEAKSEVDELQKMLVDMKWDRDRAKYQYELALEVFEQERRRASAMGRRVGNGVSQEYLRAYKVLEDVDTRACAIEFKIAKCQNGRTVSSEASENPSEDFHRQPSSV